MIRRHIYSYRFVDFAIIILIISLIIAPTTYDVFKILILIIICTSCIKRILLKNISIHINWIVFASILAILLVNIFQAITGIIRNGDYALADTKIYVVYMFIFFVLMYVLSNDNYNIKSINTGLLLGSFLLPLYTILLVISITIGGVGDSLDILKMEYMIAYGDGFLKVYGLNILSYSFTVPYTYVYYRLSSANKSTKTMLLCLFILNAIALIITLRRGIILSSIIVIIIFEIYESSTIRSMARKIIIPLSSGILVLSVFVIMNISMNSDTYNKIMFSRRSDSVRIEQTKMLLEGFSNNPIIGSGYGAHFNSYSRSTQFEMQYLKLLFTGGIMAAAVYLFGYLAIIFSLKRTLGKVDNKQRQLLYAAFFAQLALIFNNAINPFITQFSATFLFFIPFYMLNNISKCDSGSPHHLRHAPRVSPDYSRDAQ
ncbi:O-antigen ligase family protein [Gemmatimonadota bacterium]